MTKKVLIVGGGIGGLCAAIGFRRKGIKVDLVEIQAQWSVYGVGILQQANVVRAMAGLGLLREYLDSGFGFDYVRVLDPQGRPLAKLFAERLGGEDYPAMLGIGRRALHEVLVSACRRLGVRIRLGVTIASLAGSPDAISVQCTDGAAATYDLVVGADGVYSKVRELMFGAALKPRFVGQSVWRYNFPRPPEVDCLITMIGPQANAGLCPISKALMYVYVTSVEPGNPRMPAERLHELMRDRLRHCGGPIGALRPQITNPHEVVYRPLEVVLAPPPWHRDRVVLIGDAAHATTPHLGQGAGMAIEDAVVLSEEIAKDIPCAQALENFMQRRWQRCRFIWETSVSLCEAEMAGRTDIDRPGLVHRMFELTSQPI